MNVERRSFLGNTAIGIVGSLLTSCVQASEQKMQSEKQVPQSSQVPLYPAMPIADRFKGRKIPNVKGIDLEQALNYVDEGGIPIEWFYESYTNPHVFYTKGSRPQLEKLAAEITAGVNSQIDKVRKIAEWVMCHVKHSWLTLERMATNRGLTEEQLIESGCGLCNEQARVAVALSQICGMPSRMHYINRVNASGHTICEVMIDGRWAAVCATYNMVFTTPEGLPANVCDFRRDPKIWDYANACYSDAINKFAEMMPVARSMEGWKEPLKYFGRVGYCNYFIH